MTLDRIWFSSVQTKKKKKKLRNYVIVYTAIAKLIECDVIVSTFKTDFIALVLAEQKCYLNIFFFVIKAQTGPLRKTIRVINLTTFELGQLIRPKIGRNMNKYNNKRNEVIYSA